jgi:NAD(P)-dependent dehydrogenase (short-subunit alcohol dehydrogenase family)
MVIGCTTITASIAALKDTTVAYAASKGEVVGMTLPMARVPGI